MLLWIFSDLWGVGSWCSQHALVLVYVKGKGAAIAPICNLGQGSWSRFFEANTWTRLSSRALSSLSVTAKKQSRNESGEWPVWKGPGSSVPKARGLLLHHKSGRLLRSAREGLLRLPPPAAARLACISKAAFSVLAPQFQKVTPWEAFLAPFLHSYMRLVNNGVIWTGL